MIKGGKRREGCTSFHKASVVALKGAVRPNRKVCPFTARSVHRTVQEFYKGIKQSGMFFFLFLFSFYIFPFLCCCCFHYTHLQPPLPGYMKKIVHSAPRSIVKLLLSAAVCS